MLPMNTKLSSTRLKESSNFINTHYSEPRWVGSEADSTFGEATEGRLTRSNGDVEMAELFLRDQEDDVLVSGQDRLLDAVEVGHLEELELVSSTEQKEELVLLDHCLDTKG